MGYNGTVPFEREREYTKKELSAIEFFIGLSPSLSSQKDQFKRFKLDKVSKVSQVVCLAAEQLSFEPKSCRRRAESFRPQTQKHVAKHLSTKLWLSSASVEAQHRRLEAVSKIFEELGHG